MSLQVLSLSSVLSCTNPLRRILSIPLLEGLLPNRKAVEKRTPGKLELHSFSSARHWTTASVRKGLEMASPATSQNTGNIFSTWKLAIRKKKYKMSSKW